MAELRGERRVELTKRLAHKLARQMVMGDADKTLPEFLGRRWRQDIERRVAQGTISQVAGRYLLMEGGHSERQVRRVLGRRSTRIGQVLRDHVMRWLRLRRERAGMLPKVREVMNDLLSLKDRFPRCPVVYDRSDRVVICRVPEVLMQMERGGIRSTVELGPFDLKIKTARDLWSHSMIEIGATEEAKRSNGGYIHPHVSHGSLCWGDEGDELADRFLDDRQLGSLVEVAVAVLQEYNDDSPYESLSRWELLTEVPKCPECEGAMRESGECFACQDGEKCESCVPACGACGRRVCRECGIECEACGGVFCEGKELLMVQVFEHGYRVLRNICYRCMERLRCAECSTLVAAGECPMCALRRERDCERETQAEARQTVAVA